MPGMQKRGPLQGIIILLLQCLCVSEKILDKIVLQNATDNIDLSLKTTHLNRDLAWWLPGIIPGANQGEQGRDQFPTVCRYPGL